MAGCSSCEQQVGALIEAKEESGQELSEQEKKIAEGEAGTPLLYGPLAFWVDIPWCHFCVTVGIILSFIVDGILYALTPYLNPMLPFQITGEILLGFLVFEIFLDLVFGRYPILGALFGPYFEWFFAKFGIYLTWDAVAVHGPGVKSGVTPIFTQGYGGESGGGDAAASGGGKPARADGGEQKRFTKHGTEVHVIPTQEAVERCAHPLAPGALIRVEIERTPVGFRIVDWHNFDPEVNRFQNINYHVDPTANTVCQQNRGNFMTEMQFRRFVNSYGEEGIE